MIDVNQGSLLDFIIILFLYLFQYIIFVNSKDLINLRYINFSEYIIYSNSCI